MQISTAAAVNAQKHDRRHESQPIPKEMGPLFQKTHHYTVVQRINEHGQYHDPTPVPKIKGILLGCHATAPPPPARRYSITREKGQHCIVCACWTNEGDPCPALRRC